MGLKKSSETSKQKKGQATLEYFILFGMLALITIVSFSGFFTKVKVAMQGNDSNKGFYQIAMERIAKDTLK